MPGKPYEVLMCPLNPPCCLHIVRKQTIATGGNVKCLLNILGNSWHREGKREREREQMQGQTQSLSVAMPPSQESCIHLSVQKKLLISTNYLYNYLKHYNYN